MEAEIWAIRAKIIGYRTGIHHLLTASAYRPPGENSTAGRAHGIQRAPPFPVYTVVGILLSLIFLLIPAECMHRLDNGRQPAE
ncbi:MAG: hypothetical protein JL50_13715 [Peptococcaceae bacterium BICA1-7]|nr:MAG: hypothetical protein JL50_13715 [Peptococcaceae bacterium BICA1-7]